jgi:hypothetical protein
MADKAAAAEFKAKGNAALSAKDFDAAVKWYTEVRMGRANAGPFGVVRDTCSPVERLPRASA